MTPTNSRKEHHDTSPPILTSSWFTALPAGHRAIGISRGVPRGRASGYRRYMRLNPGPWFRTVSALEYRDRYYAEVLDRLDPNEVLSDLLAVAAPDRPVLVCFERPPPDPTWCHRGLVSAWLSDTLGVAVPELGHEYLGYGWHHPKLPAELMRPCPPRL